MTDLDRVPAPPLPRDLRDGLVLRRATDADLDAVAAFSGRTHAQPYDVVAEVWTRELLGGGHPNGTHERVLVVEERGSGTIVSSCTLIPQTWAYGGVAFPVGRPELVGTAPGYRGRGLVRAQFDVLHAWGEAAGEAMQVITGIPYFYRQFGYEPALGVGSLGAEVASIAALPDRTGGHLRSRPIGEADLATVVRFAGQAASRSLVTSVRGEAEWRYELFGRHRESDYVQQYELIEDDGEAVGLLTYLPYVDGGRLDAPLAEVAPGADAEAVGGALLRRLVHIGSELASDGDSLAGVRLAGGTEHPLHAAFPDVLTPLGREFFFYVRIPDIAAFVQRVGPVLEARLAASALAGYGGTLRISFYRSGIGLRFDGGRLVEVSGWQPSTSERGDAAFPDRTFLQFLLGSRSLDDLEYAFADCRGGAGEVRDLLQTLFPKAPSVPWPLG